MSISLVTGGSGFIGRHLVSELLARGEKVRILDRARPIKLPQAVEFISGSILDRDVVARALTGVDRVYHLAAIAHLWTPKQDDYDVVNRLGTEIVLAAAAERTIAKFVHCSTEAVLAPARARPSMIDEDTPTDLADMAGPYTRSKYLAEQAVLAAARSGLPAVIVNPTLPVGPGDKELTPPSAMLAHFITNPSPFFVDCVLNYVDVRDIAAGMTLAADHGRNGERYILGGDNLRLRHVTQIIAQVSGRRAPWLNLPGPIALAAGAILERIATSITRRTPAATIEGVRLALRSAPIDSGKARRELGYVTRPVEDVLVRTVSWLAGTMATPRPATATQSASPRFEQQATQPAPALRSSRRLRTREHAEN